MFNDRVFVSYEIPTVYRQVLDGSSVCDSFGCTRDAIVVDLTDVEFRHELQEMAVCSEIRTPRTAIYLKILKMDGSLRPPAMEFTKEEYEWGYSYWTQDDKRMFLITRGSNKLKEWPDVWRFKALAEAEGYEVIVSEQADGYSFPTFRHAASVARFADVVVGIDSGLTNVAAAFGIPTVTIFSNRNGQVFAQMFKTMFPVQGDCPFRDEDYCDFFAPCFGAGPHRRKENIDVPQCMKRLKPEKVWREVLRVLDK